MSLGASEPACLSSLRFGADASVVFRSPQVMPESTVYDAVVDWGRTGETRFWDEDVPVVDADAD